MLLNKIQENFKDTLLQPATGIKDCSQEFLELFEDGDISIQDRLKVYHNNVVGSISAALCATFPLLENLVGLDFLKAMARAFLFENPPKGGCLHFYGAGFDKFIETYEPATAFPYLPDIARLELAVNTAYYARDDKTLKADTLSNIPEENLENLILSPRDSVVLVDSRYPLLEIRDFCVDAADKDTPVLVGRSKTFLMVFRPELDVYFVPLDEYEYNLLQQLFEHNPLGAAVDHTLCQYPDFDFADFLQKHVTLGTFQEI